MQSSCFPLKHRSRLRLYAWFTTVMVTVAIQTSYAQSRRHFSVGGRVIDVHAFNNSVQQMLDSVGVPGMSLAIIDNNQIVYEQVYGFRSVNRKKKVNKRTLFEACSLSKTLLAYVAHQLADEGKLDLDRPVYEYLPNKSLDHDTAYKRITARHILSHSSGIENWQSMNNPDTLELVAEVGKQFVYSGEAYNYLSRIITAILRQPYEQYIQERVIGPLRLKRTSLKFTKHSMRLLGKYSPRNYATGSNIFGKENGKWLNTEAVPSSGVNLRAVDYATLLLALFSNQYFSDARIRELSQPMVRINDRDPELFMGEGFEITQVGGDVILSHDGDNPGFKSNVFYSAKQKKGFVFFTNGDRGMLVAKRLNELTTGLAIEKIFELDYYRQYPNAAIDLFKIFKDQGVEAMFFAMNQLRATAQLSENTLNQLGDEFLDYGETVRRIVNVHLELYPESALANQLMGEIFLYMNEMDSAQVFLSKAARLAPWHEEIRFELNHAISHINQDEVARRRAMVTSIDAGKPTLLQAEDYNAMYGVEKREVEEKSGEYCINYLTTDRWLDYRVYVPQAGMYALNLRVMSFQAPSVLQVRAGSTIVSHMTVPATARWNQWRTLNTMVDLRAGNQTIRVYAVSGNVEMNWLEFTKQPDQAVNNTIKLK